MAVLLPVEPQTAKRLRCVLRAVIRCPGVSVQISGEKTISPPRPPAKISNSAVPLKPSAPAPDGLVWANDVIVPLDSGTWVSVALLCCWSCRPACVCPAPLLVSYIFPSLVHWRRGYPASNQVSYPQPSGLGWFQAASPPPSILRQHRLLLPV